MSGLNYVLDAESCRAVTAPSCVGRTDPRTGRRFRPANALTVLRSHPAGSFDELVLMVGYDESYTNFRHSVVAMTQAARDHGIDHVTWLTFRTDVSYVPPLDAERDYSYRSNNSLLRSQAQNSGGFVTLLDWNGHVNSRSGLVERDGVHLTAAGAASAARLIRDSVLAHWGSSAASAGPSPAATSTSRSAIAGRNDLPTWGYGTVGEPVKELQRLLIATGASELANHGLTGRFYAVTQRAVRQFQQLVRDRHDASMVVDGVVGPVTWAWLVALSGSEPNLNRRATSSGGEQQQQQQQQFVLVAVDVGTAVGGARRGPADVGLWHDRGTGERAPTVVDRGTAPTSSPPTGSPVGSMPSPNVPCASSNNASVTATTRRWSSTASSARRRGRGCSTWPARADPDTGEAGGAVGDELPVLQSSGGVVWAQSLAGDLVAGECGRDGDVQRREPTRASGCSTIMSHRSRTSRDKPAPSAPSTRQIASRARSPSSNSVRSAASSRPTTQMPALRIDSSAAGSPPTIAIGTCSIAPAAALATVGVTCTARWRGRTTPSTPAPSPKRSSAPRLPGSVTPSTATRNGGRCPRRLIRSSKLGFRQRGGLGDDALRRLAARLGFELACG